MTNPVHPATALLREFLTVSDEFEAHLGRELTVNRTDLEAMEHLIQNGPLTPTDLARRLGLTTAATTTVVDRLIAVGHVTREPHATDRRAVVIVPQPTSVKKAMGTLMPMIRGVDDAIQGFSATEQETITRYLENVTRIYREHVPTR